MIFKTRVKFSHLCAKFCSIFKNVRCLFNRPTTSCSREGTTHFEHNYGMRFFDSKIWKKHFCNIGQKISGHINIISKTISVFHTVFIVLCDATAKCFKYPIKHFFAVIRDFQNAMVIGITIACTIGCIDVMADEKTALSIDESSQISQIQWSDFRKVVGFELGHEISFVENSYSINEDCFNNHAERLNKVTFLYEKMRKSELCGNVERGIRRVSPAINKWSVGLAKPKVTECLNEASRLLAQNLAQTMDEVTRDVLASTSSVLQCANGTNGNTPTELTKDDIDIAVRTLLSNDAEMISEVVVGKDAFGTSPVRPAFWAYIDTNLIDDLENVSNFAHSANYPNQQSVLDSEWGATGNVRWLYTSVGSVSAATPSVFNNFIIGKEAYAVVHLRSETGEFYVEPLGSAGSADPLHQRGSVGWQHPFVSRILNDAFMLNLTATHT